MTANGYPQLPTNPVTSWSDLQKFSSCKRSWYLGTYLRLRRVDEPLDGPLPFGSRIHAALEAWGKGRIGTPQDAYDILMQKDFDLAAKAGLFTDGLAKEADLGHIMLEGFPDWLDATGFDAKYEVLSVETKLSEILNIPAVLQPDGSYADVPVQLRGKLDQRLRRRSDDAVLVNDFKTTSSLSPDTIGQFVQTPQLRLYLLLERQQAPKDQWSSGYAITLLRKVKRTKTANPPFYALVERSVSTPNLAAAAQNIRAQIIELLRTRDALDHGVKAELAAPFHVSWQCKTCPFRNPCQEMQDGNWAGARDMLTEHYVIGDPWARYNQDEEDDKMVRSW
jgi:hypothetical protein